MSDMKRINSEELRETYMELGIKPVQGNFFYVRDFSGNESRVTCACGIGAIYLKKKNDFNASEALFTAKEVYGSEYTEGFICGFDGEYGYAHEDIESKANEIKQTYDEKGAVFDTEIYIQGYNDGVTCWKAVSDMRE